MKTIGLFLPACNNMTDFWREWAILNCERLNHNLENFDITFDPIFEAPKFIKARFCDSVHIFGNLLVDNASIDEVRVIEFELASLRHSYSQVTAVIPASGDSIPLIGRMLHSKQFIQRQNSFSLKLAGRELSEIFRGMSSRNRTKARTGSEKFAIKVQALNSVSAAAFEKKQYEWSVSRLNFFPIVKNFSKYCSFPLRLWTAEGSDGSLHILVIENSPDAYFFLAAPMSEGSRKASLHLHRAIISNLHARGFSYYHLGGGVSSREGVARFKLSLGSEEYKRALIIPFREAPVEAFFPEWFRVVHFPMD